MKFLQTLLSSFAIVLMLLSFNSVAAEKKVDPVQTTDKAIAATQEALKALEAGSSAEEVNKLIKDAAEVTSEIYANYKTDKARDTAIIHLKAIRAKVTAGNKDEAKAALEQSIQEIGDMKKLF